ncbi:REP-associated tyrosine transposase [Legionella worsleiensis]|uniref:Transposase IS200 like protein n=1 Tax=Legionella worsleiensis TaxID=45076 RepID=A0A0W1AIY0_9GAMM|nr:transposase [Legionella worsleiensis]KTD81192.1 Transposase IS200 like protein [Legionella worsleiensis]STY33168.1 Transposase and inactivated derivatives [Legionella worsleiensis]
MVNYRRNFVSGGTFFFTLTLRNRKSSVLIDQIHLLKEAVQITKAQHLFLIKAYVILPDHLHMIWQLPEGDANYSGRWKKIKALFSKSINKSAFPLSKTRHNEYCLWQRRFWEHTIKDAKDFENHVNYIHYNPIKHGLVECLHHWPHSSFHHYFKTGKISRNWANSVLDPMGRFGE